MSDAFVVTARDGSTLEFQHAHKCYWRVSMRSLTLEVRTEVYVSSDASAGGHGNLLIEARPLEALSKTAAAFVASTPSSLPRGI